MEPFLSVKRLESITFGGVVPIFAYGGYGAGRQDVWVAPLHLCGNSSTAENEMGSSSCLFFSGLPPAVCGRPGAVQLCPAMGELGTPPFQCVFTGGQSTLAGRIFGTILLGQPSLPFGIDCAIAAGIQLFFQWKDGCVRFPLNLWRTSFGQWRAAAFFLAEVGNRRFGRAL